MSVHSYTIFKVHLIYNVSQVNKQLLCVCRALVNLYKARPSPAVQSVGVAAFYQVVSFVCEDTLRHPPTRQYLSSCVEILGQVPSHTHSHTHTHTHSNIYKDFSRE